MCAFTVMRDITGVCVLYVNTLTFTMDIITVGTMCHVCACVVCSEEMFKCEVRKFERQVIDLFG